MNHIQTLVLCGIFTLGLIAGTIAQPATIRGKVTNGSTGENLIGATILLQGNNYTMKGGAYSDIEASHNLQAPVGDYKLIISYIGFLPDILDIQPFSR